MLNRKTHPFHLVDPSPWPVYAATNSLVLVAGLVGAIHSFPGGSYCFVHGLLNTFLVAGLWWRDVIREGTYGGYHTVEVQRGLSLGFGLFLVSEVMFFFSFFWAFFYLALNPSLEIGGIWPPSGIIPMSPTGIPLLNTVLLVWSGFTLTYAHNRLIARDLITHLIGMAWTLGLGFIFLFLQAYEYYVAQFDISDVVYGSCFYLLTGFHGLHVLIGFVFLLVNTCRAMAWHFYAQQHLGVIFGAWYWHFVDVVWLALYFVVYVWGNK